MIYRACNRYDCVHCRRPREGVEGGCTFGRPFDFNEPTSQCKDYCKFVKYERKIYATDEQVVEGALQALDKHPLIIDNGKLIYEALLRFKEHIEKEKELMSQKPIIAFTCPTCCNHTVYSTEQDVRDVSQVKKDEIFVCEECGEEFNARPSNSGKTIKFVRRLS